MSKRKKRKDFDFTILLATILLVLIGIIMVFSSSWPDSIRKVDNGYFFLRKQIIAAALGFVALLFFTYLDYRILQFFSWPIFIGSIIIGALIFTPYGVNLKGATRWVDLGFINFSPSDILKLGSIIFLADFISKRKDKIQTIVGGLIPVLIIMALPLGLIIVQPDLSTTFTLGVALMSMFYVGGIKISHLVVLIGGAIGGVVYAILDEPYRLNRITAFTRPFERIQFEGWQVVQSLYALGSGGLFGVGLGKSRQKFFYIPEPYNDFIFAIIGEELGFIGNILVILLIFVIIWRGIRVAVKVNDLFGSLLATGIVVLIGVQSLIHIAVVSASMPPTGIPLPLVSYGGTSLVIYMSMIGILLNISKYVKE